jgi:hypothetical protein
MVSFLTDPNPKRLERHGVRFRLVIEGPKERFQSFIDIRIKPNVSTPRSGKSESNGPYVVAYAADQDNDFKSGEITYWHSDELRTYEDTMKPLAIEDWYRVWLSKAFEHEKVAKIFAVKESIK